jgi:hypothetical protein
LDTTKEIASTDNYADLDPLSGSLNQRLNYLIHHLVLDSKVKITHQRFPRELK